MPQPLLFSLFPLFASLTAAAPPIVIDGKFGDWRDVAVVLDDPADAPRAAVDFGALRVTHDDRFVYLLIELGRTVNVQRLKGRIDILLDVDADGKTGRTVLGMRGVDLIIEFSPRDPGNPDRAGRGAAVSFPTDRGDRRQLSPYTIGLVAAPTYAGDVVELRMERGGAFPGAKSLFSADSIRGRLVYLDRNGTVLDDTSVFAYDLTPVEPVPADRGTDPLARPAGTQLRVMTWNTGMDGLRTRPRSFERILHAIDPDVILFQELTEADHPRQIEAYLKAWTTRRAGERWTVLRGAGGGQLRCAVASRLQLNPYAALDPLLMPDRPDRSIRVIGAELTLAGHRLLVVSAHLRCCGYAGSFEDRTRVVEADAIRRAIADAVASGRFEGVIVGGDLNLVGSRWPLDILAENLKVVEPLQFGGRSNTTWWDVRQPFLPGRLDFLLVTDTSPAVRRSFVFDSRLVGARWLRHHRLRAGDTVEASDHLPVVVDLSWVAPPAE